MIVEKEYCNQPPGCAAPQILEDIREIKEELRAQRAMLEQACVNGKRAVWLGEKAQDLEMRVVTKRELQTIVFIVSAIVSFITLGINFVFQVVR